MLLYLTLCIDAVLTDIFLMTQVYTDVDEKPLHIGLRIPISPLRLERTLSMIHLYQNSKLL